MLRPGQLVAPWARQFIVRPRLFNIASITVRRYASHAEPGPKLNPLDPQIPGELDPRFSELPPWTVPVVNRQDITETPVQPYYDVQNRRYYGEPVCIPTESSCPLMLSYPSKTKFCRSSHSTTSVSIVFHLH